MSSSSSPWLATYCWIFVSAVACSSFSRCVYDTVRLGRAHALRVRTFSACVSPHRRREACPCHPCSLCRFNQSSEPRAIKYYETQIANDEKLLDLRTDLAELYKKLKAFDEARRILNDALKYLKGLGDGLDVKIRHVKYLMLYAEC